MRVPRPLVAALALALVAHAASPTRAAAQPLPGADASGGTGGRRLAALALRDVAIVDVTDGTIVAGQTVLVEGDRIRAIGPTTRVVVPPGATVLEAAGRYLVPGLWDMHTHSLDRWRWAFPLHVANGVTGIRDLATSVPLAELRRLRAEVGTGVVTGPRFVAAGPLVDGPGSSRRYLSVRSADEARAVVDSLHREGADFIKVYDLLPREAFHAVIEAAGRRGLPVVGHVPEAFDDPSEALAAGMRSVEHADVLHLLCATGRAEVLRLVARSDSARARGDTRRADELLERAGGLRFTSYSPSLCESQARAIAARGTWLTPTLTLHLQSLPRVDVPTDTLLATPEYRYVPRPTVEAWRGRHAAALAAADAGERERQREQLRQTLAKVGIAHRSGVGLLAGTDGSASFQVFGFNLHDELGWLVEAGLTPLAALQTATVNPARFLGREHVHGSVAEGKLADLVLLDGNPLLDIANTRRIHAVVLGGRLLRRRDLDALLARVEDLHAAAR